MRSVEVTTRRLQSVAAAVMVVLATMTPSTTPSANAQTAAQTGPPAQTSASRPSEAPAPVPEPIYTKPFDMRPSERNYRFVHSHFPNPLAPYEPVDVRPPMLNNTTRLDDLVKDGKIYLSLNDAIALTLENNFDIAVARYNLDIADLDIVRAEAGSPSLRGVSTGLVTGTLGGATSTLSSGGGPGGTTTGSGGAGTGASGLVLSTLGSGPTPEYLDPVITGTANLERAKNQLPFTYQLGTGGATSAICGGATVLSTPVCNTNTANYDIAYVQGFTPGAELQVGFNNSRIATGSPSSLFSPELSSMFRAELTQHLLQGRGFFINRRFIIQAKNDRQITDSAFRQQLMYTINQVENIYWGLVSAYEDEQSKERALEQSKQLASDNRKQLEIGTLAPLDVVNADASVASDQQGLTNSKTTLEYQQLVMKQAIARNLSDPVLSAAPVIPTDRVSLTELPEERQPVEELVQQAFQNRPEVEQAALNLKNDELTIKALRNGLLPIVDVYGFYGASAVGGTENGGATNGFKNSGYGDVFNNTFNNALPDKGAGVNVNITLRNRVAQSDQVRSQLEYRQAQMKLQQVYTQIRIQVINGQFALTQDRGSVQSAQAAQYFAAQSLDAERKKYRLGASTTALVLSQQRNLAVAEDNLIAAQATYARDRASFYQVLASTLDRYGISISDSAAGKVNAVPSVPGLEAPSTPPSPTLMQEQQLQHPGSPPVANTPAVPAPQPVQAAPPPPADHATPQ